MNRAQPDEALLLTFAVGNRLLAVPATLVLEVSREFTVTRVPGAARAIAGVINFRGEIIVAIDMAHRLGLDDPAEASRALCIFLAAEQTSIAMLVDRVLPMCKVSPSMIDKAIADSASDRLLRGVVRLPDSLLTLVDVGELLPAIERSRSEITLKAPSVAGPLE